MRGRALIIVILQDSLQMISAKDEGMKASTATVNIIVTDVNDQNPAFKNLPYSFRVKEGEVGAFVGWFNLLLRRLSSYQLFRPSVGGGQRRGPECQHLLFCS